MAPLREKLSNLKKSQSENFDSKTSRFSFRWFLKRSKSSKTTKEMTSTEKAAVPTIVISKSCDTEMANFKLDKYSTSLLWKLLPNRGKLISETDKTKKQNKDRNFKLSYSCSDVHSMMTAPDPSSVVRSASSSYNIDNLDVKSDKSSSQCLYNRGYRNQSTDYSKLFCKAEKLETTSEQFAPNAQQFVLCKLCLMMVPQHAMFVLEDCGCSFCVSCMQQYLMISIKEGNVTIMCPDAECAAKGKVLVCEIQDLVGDEVFYKFQKYKLDRDVELDPFRTWCPTPGCETICQFYSSFNTETGMSVHCLNCKFTFCSSCKLRWHTNKTCEEMKKILQDEEDFNSDDEDAIIKRCPNCRVPIERDEGCAQMMCKRCKHVFCWHCLSSLDDDFLLRHYDKGPCRNKLGHSRASMVWHRTQVVGIFAGFSFLLLVASPILLLAAPCLLCCRCKSCKFFYEEATPL